MTAPELSQSQAARTGGVKEWFWLGNALQDAKSASAVTATSRERLRRARLAAEFAGRMIDPAEPWYDGSALPLAISLYREATFWVLLAQSENEEQTTTLRELLATQKYATANLSDADVELVKKVLGEQTFVQTADESPDALRREAVLCRTFVHGLIRTELAADRRVSRVLLQRLLRIGAVVVLALAVILGLNAVVKRALRGADLAEGKPWTASSKAFECHPAQGECGGGHTKIFFHTLEQDNPWVEIDLGAKTRFSRVEVENREDCCQDRASPAVIEVSNDGSDFKEVARTTEPYETWDATFAPVSARYVRVKVLKKAYLHLVRVGVRAR